MPSYKEDQGRLTRMFAFWILAFLLLFGCSFLHDQLFQWIAALREPLGGLSIPIVGVAVNGAFLIAAIVFLGALTLLIRWQRKPKVSDTLIETEQELRKVSWPTFDNVVNSSLVVITTVLFLMGFMAACDWVFGRIFRRLLLG